MIHMERLGYMTDVAVAVMEEEQEEKEEVLLS
jgi:hypothetical protein